jgi:hypothetical protein
MPFDIGGTIYSGLEIQKFAKAGIVTNGLVLHLDAAYKNSYPTGGTTWYDLSGNGNNGTMTNGPIYSSDSDGIITFDGSNDYITTTYGSNINPYNNPISCQFWVKLNDISASQILLTSHQSLGNGDVNQRLYVGNHNGKWDWGISSSAWGSGTVECDDKWHLITIVIDSSNAKFYLDTQLIYTKAVNSTYVLNYNFTIGKHDSSYYSNCLISNLKVYNRALSADEIRQNYYATKNRFEWEYTPPVVVTTGLVLHLDAGDSASYPGSGTAWYDLSGNGNTLSLVNGPTYDSSNGGSIVFDGVNDYAWDTSTTYSSAGATSYSASIWINLNSSTSGVDKRFFWRGHYNILMYKASGNALRAYIRTEANGNANLALVPSSWSFDSWINMTCTFGGGIFKYYVNSVLIDSSNIGGSIKNDVSNRIELGAKASENTYYTNCKISSVLEYNRELSQAEITQNYNALKGRFGL